MLNEKTGRLNVTSTSGLTLDEFDLTVSAQDKGSPQRVTTATVHVTLTDMSGKNVVHIWKHMRSNNHFL